MKRLLKEVLEFRFLCLISARKWGIFASLHFTSEGKSICRKNIYGIWGFDTNFYRILNGINIPNIDENNLQISKSKWREATKMCDRYLWLEIYNFSADLWRLEAPTYLLHSGFSRGTLPQGTPPRQRLSGTYHHWQPSVRK